VNSYGRLDTDLPLSAWIKILDELSRSKLIKLTITGGEPTYRPDFTEFLAEVYSRPFRFSLNTNGTMITSQVLKTLKLYSSRLDDIMISLDGPDAQTVDSQRGQGVFDKMILGIERLHEAGLPFGFYCTVTALNVNRLGETAELAMSLGARWIKFNNFLMAGPILENSMIPDIAQVISAAEELSAVSGKYPGKILGTILEMRERIQKLMHSVLPEVSNAAYSCGGGVGKIAVFPDGRVTPCDHLPEVTLGNITEQSLENILKGKEMKKFSDYLNQPRTVFPDCANCKYLSYCTGGCPVESLNSNEEVGYDRHSCLKIYMGEK